MGQELMKRRKHKNSKLGCPNCKKRRVKCSEDLPQCLNCIKHKVKCGYLDYSKEQIEELKAAKAQVGLDKDKDQKRSIFRDGAVGDRRGDHEVHRNSTINHNQTNNLLPVTSSGIESSHSLSKHPSINNLNALELTTVDSNELNDEIENLSIGLKPTTHYYNNFSNILNHSNNHISQNFDNLLTTEPDKELSIIYPVYSIVNNQGLSPFDMNNFGDQHNLSHMDLQGHTPNFVNLDRFLNDGFQNNPPHDHEDIQQNLLQSLVNSSSVPQDYLINISSPPQIATSKNLPNSINQVFKFKKLKKIEHNYRELLIDTVIQLGPLISSGTASLIQIRGLYNLWLNSFLYKSYDSDLMFSCLINLTTNFLISNIFNNFNLIESNANNFINITNTKNILILLTIKYYAIVIKGIRIYLNKNFDPELCSSVSYILSLMSIYDPEVSLNSINCFTDGLFSVLKFNLNLSIKKGFTPPILIPVHLKLMENLQKSIYFPGYNPNFLNEYKIMLNQFGTILSKINLENHHMNLVLNKHYSNLWNFTNSSIDEYLPILISNQDNNQIQQEILFKMTSTWVRLFPSRLLIINKNSHIMEKVLYLFFKLFKKSLFAIVPQVKYYFLRDFDSPLMLDVFNFIDDNQIFFDDDLNLPYLSKHRDHLKYLISYCVRALNFFLKRVQYLYKTVVYKSHSKNLFPVPQERKSFIIDIPKFRKIFYETLNIKEVNITEFSKTPIKPYHFPHTEEITIEQDDPVEVDFMTMMDYGFLKEDIVF